MYYHYKNCPEDIKNQICELYLFGLSIKNIKQKINVGYLVCTKVLKERNIRIKEPREVFLKYSFDYNFFEKINTEDKAYFLGFLYADGYHNEKRNTVCIKLSSKDCLILEKFKNLLNYNGKIYTRTVWNGNSQSELCFTNAQTSCDLIKLGLTQNKSLTLTFPTQDQVPEHLIHHFIRGYFDGDGSIFVDRKNSNMVGMNIIGSREFISTINTILAIQCELNTTSKREFSTPNENMSYYRLYGRKQLWRVYKFIFLDATIYLDRKYNLFTNIVEKYKNQTSS